MAYITIDDAKDHLGIDYADDTIARNLTRMMATAEATLRGAVGDDIEEYLPDDPRAKDLTLAYLAELYEERALSAKAASATRSLLITLEWQLKMELDRAREAAQA